MLFPATDEDGEEISWESKICPISINNQEVGSK